MTSILYISAILHVILAIYLLLQQSRDKSIKIFSLFLTSIAAWSVANAEFANSDSEKTMLFWTYFAYTAASILLYSLYLFAFTFDANTKLGFGSAAAFTIFISSLVMPYIPNLIIAGVDFEKKSIIGTSLLPLLFLTYIYFMLSSVWKLQKLVKKNKGIRKTQLRFIFTGVTLSIIAGTTTNLVLPSLNNYDFVTLGPSFTLVLLSFVSMSIVRYEFLNLRLTLGRFLKYIILALTLILSYYISLYINIILYNDYLTVPGLILSVPLSLLVTLFYEYTRGYLDKSIIRKIITHDYNYNEVLNKFNLQISKLMLKEEIEKIFTDKINSVFEPSTIEIIFESDTNKKSFNQLINSYKYVANLLNVQYIIVDKLKISSHSTSRQVLKLIKILDEMNVNLVVNFGDESSYSGYLLLGRKKNNEIYIKSDADFISLLSNTFILSLERAYLYQEVQSFNENLQHQIDAATVELKSKNKALSEALRKERDMLDILGHELRTPLGTARNAIMMLNMVRKSERIQEDDKTEHYLKIATENIVREVKILETILSSARIENDRLDLTFEKVDANDVINDSFESYKSQAEKKGLNITVTPSKKSAFAYADRTATQQVMDNLVSNAIKYTEEGSIEVSVTPKARSIEFSVKDSGEGIPKEEMKNLGKKFYRIKPYLESGGKLGERQIVRPGGTGIGLFVVFNLLKNMNGKLKIESEVGKGSTFTFSLPIFKGQPKKEIHKSDVHVTPKVKAINSLEEISKQSVELE